MGSKPFINKKILVTVILPVRNEESHIFQCLSAAINQDYPKENLEIIVADGMSTDHTREIVTDLQTANPNLRLIENPGQIVPTGLNEGIRQARGDIIVRVDGHTIIAPDYVSECVRALQKSGADNVGGKMDGVGKTPFGKAVVLATSSPFGIGNARFHYSDREEFVDTVYLGAWPKEVFQRVGLFDEEMVRDQDDEFNYRMRQGGGKILLSPGIKSVYTVRETPRGLWKQYFQYGFWKVRVLQKHPRQMSIRQSIPPVFVSALALFSVLSVFSRISRYFLGLISNAYLAANFAASIAVGKKRNGYLIPRLSIAFAILHMAYGTGFISGTFQFWKMWKAHGKKLCV
jgi:succinoglycan biosynthesis protein ExoA